MARNTGNGFRRGGGLFINRSQFQLNNGDWAKRNTEDGQFMDRYEDRFKGVRRERPSE